VTLRRQAAERQLNAENAKRDAQNQAQQSLLDSQQAQLAAERARAAQAEADADRARASAAAEAQAELWLPIRALWMQMPFPKNCVLN